MVCGKFRNTKDRRSLTARPAGTQTRSSSQAEQTVGGIVACNIVFGGITMQRFTKLPFMTRSIVMAIILPMFLTLSAQARANDLAGTWSGTLTGTKTFPTQFTFSDSGNMVLTYVDNRNQIRRAELSEAGQQIQYVPRGGGVMT